MLQKEYIALGKHCREIAVGFLENCRTSDEVSLLLSQPHDVLHDVTHVGRYPRLRLALDYEQKEVRSSPHQTITPFVLCEISVAVSVELTTVAILTCNMFARQGSLRLITSEEGFTTTSTSLSKTPVLHQPMKSPTRSVVGLGSGGIMCVFSAVLHAMFTM